MNFYHKICCRYTPMNKNYYLWTTITTKSFLKYLRPWIFFANPLVPFNKWNYFLKSKIVNGCFFEIYWGPYLAGVSVFLCFNSIKSFLMYYFPSAHAHTRKHTQRSLPEWKADHLPAKCDPLYLRQISNK